MAKNKQQEQKNQQNQTVNLETMSTVDLAMLQGGQFQLLQVTQQNLFAIDAELKQRKLKDCKDAK